MTWPVPSKPASVNGVLVTVALWIIARAAALRRRCWCLEATLMTSTLPAKNETRPMKHATCSSAASPSWLDPPAPLPEYRRWSRPEEVCVAFFVNLNVW